MNMNQRRHPPRPARRISMEVLAIILVAVFLLGLCIYVYCGISQYTEARLRVMTVLNDERAAEKRENNPIPIDPPVLERAKYTFRDYVLTMLFLTAFFVMLSLLNRWKNGNLQALLCPIFLLLGLSCSMRVLYPGFYGLTDEAGFLIIGCFVMVGTFFLWPVFSRWMENYPEKNSRTLPGRLRLGTILYILLALFIIAMIVLNVLQILRGKDETIHGAYNWIRIAGITLQPSEFVKAGLIVLAGCSVVSAKRKYCFCALAVLACIVVAAAKDIGAAFVIGVLFVAAVQLLFDEEWLSIGIICVFIVGFILIMATSSTAQTRIANWGNAMTIEDDQQRDFITTVIRGGWQGVGIADANEFFWIFAGGTDGVIAGIQAIYGLPMAVIVIGCYILLILQCGFSKNVNPSSQPILLLTALYIAVQVLLNYGGSLDVVPFTGIVAPLLSQGGSSTLTTMALMGVMGACLYSSVDNRRTGGKEYDYYEE